MSDRRFYHLLRGQGLPIALVCALVAALGGCSTLRISDLVRFGSPASCQSDAWPTKVFGSVQRSKSHANVAEPVAEYSYEPPEDNGSEHVAEAHTYAEPLKAAPPQVPVAKPPPVAPLAPVAKAPAVEQQSNVVPEPPPAEPQSNVVPKPPPAEPQHDVVAHLPEPVLPRPPSPEVVEVCGAADTACQDQLAALLADPLHKWIKAPPTSHDDRTGLRILAYRVLTPVLACEDLRRGLRETESAAADVGSEATTPEATEGAKTLKWVQLLRRAVNLELKSEIHKRC